MWASASGGERGQRAVTRVPADQGVAKARWKLPIQPTVDRRATKSYLEELGFSADQDLAPGLLVLVDSAPTGLDPGDACLKRLRQVPEGGLTSPWRRHCDPLASLASIPLRKLVAVLISGKWRSECVGR